MVSPFNPFQCPKCKCQGPPCCEDTTPQQLWAIFSYMAFTNDGPPHGCGSLLKCGKVNERAVEAYYSEPEIVPFILGITGSQVVTGTMGCFPVRVITYCGLHVEGLYQVTFPDADGIVTVGAFTACPPLTGEQLGCIAGNVDSVGRTEVFLTDYDPTDGIIIPGTGVTLPLHMTLNLIFQDPDSGLPVPYSCELTFTPQGGLLGTKCYTWSGCFLNCFGFYDWVTLQFDESGGTWDFTVFEDANTGFPADNVIRLLDANPVFSTSGVSTTSSHRCGAVGVMIPWSLS